MQGGCSTWRVLATAMTAGSLVPCSYLLVKNIQGFQLALLVTSLKKWTEGMWETEEDNKESYSDALMYIFTFLRDTTIAGIGLSSFGIIVSLISILLVQFQGARNGLFLYLVYMPLYMLTLLILNIINSIHFQSTDIEYTVVLSLSILFCIFAEVIVYKRIAEMRDLLDEGNVLNQGRVYPSHFQQPHGVYSQAMPAMEGGMYSSQFQPAPAGYSQTMPKIA